MGSGIGYARKEPGGRSLPTHAAHSCCPLMRVVMVLRGCFGGHKSVVQPRCCDQQTQVRSLDRRTSGIVALPLSL